MRHALMSSAGVLQRLGTVEVKLIETDKRLDTVFDALDRGRLLPSGIIPANTEFDSIRQVSRLVESAKSEIVVIDPYADATILDVLSGKKAGVPVRLVCKNRGKPSIWPTCEVWDKPRPLNAGRSRPLRAEPNRVCPRSATFAAASSRTTCLSTKSLNPKISSGFIVISTTCRTGHRTFDAPLRLRTVARRDDTDRLHAAGFARNVGGQVGRDLTAGAEKYCNMSLRERAGC